MPEPRPARARVLALATALAVGFGLLVAPAAVAAEAAPSAAPVSETSGEWHTKEPAARQAAPQAVEPRALVAATPPANDLRENATVVTSLPYSTYSAQYDGATLSDGETASCRTTDPDNTEYFSEGRGSVWFKYVSTKRQTLTFGGTVPESTSTVSAFVDGPITDSTRISCTESGFRAENFVQAEAGKTYYFQVSADYYSTSTEPAGTAEFFLSASAAIPNTTYSSASVVSALPATINGSTSKIDRNWYRPYSGCDFNAFMGSVWYKYRAASSGTVHADLGESYFPANVGVYDSDGVTPGTLLECPDQSTEAGEDYSYDRANTDFTTVAGKTYFIQVSNFGFNRGDFVLKLSNVATLTAPTPSITGSATVGNTLTAVPGTWGPQPVALSYQWLNDGYPINGATGPQYVVADSDFNESITVQVTGTKAGYATAARTSAAVTVTSGSLTNSVPTVTGSAAIGGTLTANPGNWGPAPVELAYQWKRNGTAIAGATGSSYVVASADSGTALTVSVTGTKYGYTTATRTSSATQVGLPLQTLMPTPTISGSTTVGSTLTANPGTWDSGVTLSYQWKKNGGTYISGATAKTYVLKASDAGATLTVSVTGTKTGYSPATKTSATTAAVTNGAVITGATPTITGTATVGQKLTAVPGTWTPSPVTLAYQWQRNGTAISGATATTYTLVAADADAAITVAVTGTKSGYTAVTKTSAAVTAKAALQTLMPTPTITGTTKVGSTLTANPGTWDAGTTLSYQWKKNGGTYISGATAKTYVLKASDAGATITVSVTSTKTGYSPATKTSATTALVTGGVLTGATPTITGTAKVGQTLTAVPGTWSPAPVTLSYQWKRGGTAISGATSATYKTVSADAGKAITVTVTGTKAGYTTLSKTSAAKTVVK
ncbi:MULTISPECIES: hypothetical protein [unclassified Rathayibacter]|uniref:hypothetical protein n=1 Tax=unclassified Rathayibacter TaxID=2609250 RepID=UPI000F9A95EC|nr:MULTISPECIES: hypothetical protein [unclassified Rathayibacter]ROP56689.1 hypothetical protein EDF45_0209 [Rathayibacter sp. PhB186]ROS55074.1 hypothetical protein EDF44_0209 [Rathayibacter sp. PhB185]